MLTYYNCIVLLVLLPLFGSVVVGLMPKRFPQTLAHRITIPCVAVSFILSLLIGKWFLWDVLSPQEILFYVWGISGSIPFHFGFLLDSLAAIMLMVVTFISLLVHIYSMGYMADDPGYRRFFCYISFFTFAMLLLVSANNFLQLYVGWEGVGLASYLLIGFWFKKESANAGSLKAFLVNRVGDFGFILGISAIVSYFGTLNYWTVFNQAPELTQTTITVFSNTHWSILTVICILLFIGAMGKSAQMPLHVWLPESMEGPTPISALIHAATMVTAGVYMVARMSPLFEYSPSALSFILIVGATTAFFTGLLALVQNDIKRIIAYSTLSQLGYMVAALGASAYTAAIFHLVTHACFKALLFLTAGAVIIALHHEQNIQKMGNLRRYLPITCISFFVGALALSAIPPFSGFYSKDAIIESVESSSMFGAHYAYVCLLLGAFVTALYIFRAFFLIFFTDDRVPAMIKRPIHEPSWMMWVPSLILVIPSTLLGFFLFEPLLKKDGLLSTSIKVLPIHMTHKGFLSSEMQLITFWQRPAVWFSLVGIFIAWYTVIKQPNIRQLFIDRFSLAYRLLVDKYGFDRFNQVVFVTGSKRLGNFLFNIVDLRWLDGYLVNGAGKVITYFSAELKRLQSGYLYHYIFAMVLGILFFLIAYFFIF